MRLLLVSIRELYSFSPGRFVVNLLLMVGLGLLESIGVLMIIPLLGFAGVIPGLDADSGFTFQVRQFLADIGLSFSLTGALVLYTAIIFAQGGLQQFQSNLSLRLQQDYNVYRGVRLFKAIAYADWQVLLTKTKSDMINVIIGELMRVYSGISGVLSISASVMITAIQIGVAFLFAPGLTCLVLVGAAVMFVVLQTFVKESRKTGQELTDLNRALLFDLTEHMNGLKEVKSYGLEAAQVFNFAAVRSRMKDNMVKFTLLQARTGMLYKAGAAFFISVCLYFAIEVFRLDPQSFLLISVISARLWPRFSGIQLGIQNIVVTFPSFQVVAELEGQCLSTREKLPENVETGRLELKCGVEFRGVSFSYDQGRRDYAVNDVNLLLPAGTTSAFVGVSGAGKSTMVDLLIGLLTPNEGEILIDGEPLTANLRPWRNSIGYVPQDAFLLNATIRDNLLWACPAATPEDMWEALRLAAVDSFIRGLPDGLDTIVGDRGVRLSGGERQRIVLARALLRRPSVLILDEATSSLDSENEQRIQQAIDNLQGKLTIVVIAHRISTIRNADSIIVMERGRVVEQGDYQSLLEKENGRFHALAAIYSNQGDFPGTTQNSP